jgi:hypothetical protein
MTHNLATWVRLIARVMIAAVGVKRMLFEGALDGVDCRAVRIKEVMERSTDWMMMRRDNSSPYPLYRRGNDHRERLSDHGFNIEHLRERRPLEEFEDTMANFYATNPAWQYWYLMLQQSDRIRNQLRGTSQARRIRQRWAVRYQGRFGYRQRWADYYS